MHTLYFNNDSISNKFAKYIIHPLLYPKLSCWNKLILFMGLVCSIDCFLRQMSFYWLIACTMLSFPNQSLLYLCLHLHERCRGSVKHSSLASRVEKISHCFDREHVCKSVLQCAPYFRKQLLHTYVVTLFLLPSKSKK